MLNCLPFFMFPPFSLKWVRASDRFEAFGREPVCRRLAKRDAGSSRSGGFSPPRRGILCTGLLYCTCIFHVARTSAQHGALRHSCAHTRRLGRKPHTAATRASRRRTVPAVEGCKDANRSRRYPLALLLRQAPEPLVGAALRKNAEISLCDFQRPL